MGEIADDMTDTPKRLTAKELLGHLIAIHQGAADAADADALELHIEFLEFQCDLGQAVGDVMAIMKPVVEAAKGWNRAHCAIASVCNDPCATKQDQWRADNEHKVRMEKLHEAVSEYEEKWGDADDSK